MYFVDVMDPTRLLQVVSTEKNQKVCKVYFRDIKNLNLVPIYWGKSNVPVSLFEDTPQNKYRGFVPWNKDAELERQRQIEAYQKRQNQVEEDDDFDDDFE